CARCHDHKFDPVLQREFYQLFAFFNNVPENGKAIKFGNSPPLIPAPTPAQQEELRRLDARLKTAEERWTRLAPELDVAQQEWEKHSRYNWPTDAIPVREGLLKVFDLDDTTPKDQLRDGKPSSTDSPLIKEFLFNPGALLFDGQAFFDGGDVGKFGFYDKFSLTAWVLPKGDKGGTVLSRMKDEPRGEGYSVGIKDGRLQGNLVKRWLHRALPLAHE